MIAVSITAVFLSISKRNPEVTEDIIITTTLSNMPEEFLNR